METRSKKKKRLEETSSSSSSSTTFSSSSSYSNVRYWCDLPEALLLSILDLLVFSIPDICSFAAVCRSWRSAAAAGTAALSPTSCGPPLLLTPVLLPGHRPRPRWSGQPRCSLKTLANDPQKSYLSLLPSKILRKKCIGYAHAHLIFNIGEGALMLDIFTGARTPSPKFPRWDPYLSTFHIGILTAPPSSPDCALVLVGSSNSLVWRPGKEEWVREEYLRNGQEIACSAVFKGKVYCVDNRYRVKIIDFDLPVSWKTMELKLENSPPLHGHFGKYLVECGGELLLIVFGRVERQMCRIDAYRLDFSKAVWVKKEGLGDWCLFIDVLGNSPVACSNPARWGGMSNCIYVAGPGRGEWAVFPLDGSMIDVYNTRTVLRSLYKELLKWPSPIWVYPNKLF